MLHPPRVFFSITQFLRCFPDRSSRQLSKSRKLRTEVSRLQDEELGHAIPIPKPQHKLASPVPIRPMGGSLPTSPMSQFRPLQKSPRPSPSKLQRRSGSHGPGADGAGVPHVVGTPTVTIHPHSFDLPSKASTSSIITHSTGWSSHHEGEDKYAPSRASSHGVEFTSFPPPALNTSIDRSITTSPLNSPAASVGSMPYIHERSDFRSDSPFSATFTDYGDENEHECDNDSFPTADIRGPSPLHSRSVTPSQAHPPNQPAPAQKSIYRVNTMAHGMVPFHPHTSRAGASTRLTPLPRPRAGSFSSFKKRFVLDGTALAKHLATTISQELDQTNTETKEQWVVDREPFKLPVGSLNAIGRLKFDFRLYEDPLFEKIRNMEKIDRKLPPITTYHDQATDCCTVPSLADTTIVSELSPGHLFTEKIRANFSKGASTSFFCRSAGGRFIVKTLPKEEVKSLLELMPSYVDHMR